LLLRLRSHLGCTIILIEHDIPLLMGLATRVVAMDTGRAIAEGAPAEIRINPAVVTSYLGGDLAAIERSGAPPPTGRPTVAGGERCEAPTRAGNRCTRPAGPDGLCATHRKGIVAMAL
jgi:ABC-type microcin C transport system duplicated ATPase subunit YejF